jgi:hypothetical protein
MVAGHVQLAALAGPAFAQQRSEHGRHERAGPPGVSWTDPGPRGHMPRMAEVVARSAAVWPARLRLLNPAATRTSERVSRAAFGVNTSARSMRGEQNNRGGHPGHDPGRRRSILAVAAPRFKLENWRCHRTFTDDGSDRAARHVVVVRNGATQLAALPLEVACRCVEVAELLNASASQSAARSICARATMAQCGSCSEPLRERFDPNDLQRVQLAKAHGGQKKSPEASRRRACRACSSKPPAAQASILRPCAPMSRIIRAECGRFSQPSLPQCISSLHRRASCGLRAWCPALRRSLDSHQAARHAALIGRCAAMPARPKPPHR